MADPTPSSVSKMFNDKRYTKVSDEDGCGCVWVVYKHKSSGTFWRTAFTIRLDDSDANLAANWTQVFPKEETTTTYTTEATNG